MKNSREIIQSDNFRVSTTKRDYNIGMSAALMAATDSARHGMKYS
jgi:hypothetical protein